MAKLTDKSLATAVTLNSLIHIVNTGDTTQSPLGSSYKAELSQLVPLFGSNPDVTVTGGTYNPSTGEITFYNNTGGTFNVSGFITGFTDSYVSGGTYSLGTATFTNTTGGTFNVSGFFTGGTDVYLTGGTYTSGNATFTNTTGGTFVVTGFTEPFSGGSGNCITDLFVSNIHSCSPLNINPLDEGNVYFGSTSGVTIDVTNSRLGIGVGSPTYSVQVLGNDSTFWYDPTSVGGHLALSGNTSLPRFGLSIAPYLSKPSTGGNLGLRCWDDASYPGYGKVGDMFVYVGNETNGLNLINGPGTNTDDYIRFYAGKIATSTADVHIQGSGSTKGYVGIGTETPSAKLDVNGKTKTTNFQMTSGATNGYVLTSDASGNASWQASSGGVSIDPYYTEPSAISITWDVSGNSTNYQTVLTANTTLNLSNVRNGDYGTIIVQQDGVGSRTMTFGTVNGAGSTHRVANGGAGIPVLTSNPNAIDILTFTYNGSVMYWTVGNDYT